MRRLLYFALVLFLASCSKDECDCTECEEKLKSVLMNTVTPIDLPKEIEKPVSSEPREDQITAIVFENNMYGFNDDETQYTLDEYKDALGKKMDESPEKIREIKIAGHKFAHYESVFQVLAFCQANELNPVLAYDK